MYKKKEMWKNSSYYRDKEVVILHNRSPGLVRSKIAFLAESLQLWSASVKDEPALAWAGNAEVGSSLPDPDLTILYLHVSSSTTHGVFIMRSPASAFTGNPSQPWTAVRAHLEEYCQSSSLHGLQYIGDRKRSRVERLFWVLAFTLSICSCSWLVHRLWNKWDTSPVIVTFADQDTPMWQIPFPAVTICPPTRAMRDNISVLDHANGPVLNLEQQMVRNCLMLTCHFGDYSSDSKQTIKHDFDDDALDIIYKYGMTTRPLLKLLMYNGRIVDKIIVPILTEDGLCFTFNMLDAKELFTDAVKNNTRFLSTGRTSEWSLNDGYSQSAGLDTYPRRALGTGSHTGLSIIFQFDKRQFDGICLGRFLAFKMILHNPVEIPQVRNNFFYVSVSGDTLIAVKPLMIATSSTLAKLPPKKRQCVYSAERPLKFFKIYTQSNCQLECLTNYTLKTCDCVAFYMPRTHDVKICGLLKLPCTFLAQDDRRLSDIAAMLNGSGAKCNCMPACTELTYDIETSHTQTTEMRYAGAQIFFKDSQFISRKRNELYGPADFVANCGGLLGLFLGFSLLSAVELIYYCSLRIFCKPIK